MLQICSLGGGKASTAMFLKSLHGHIDAKVDAAIWADTGFEPQSTHDTIGRLTEYAKDFGVKIHIVQAKLGDGDIRKAMLNPDSRNGQIPMYSRNLEGKKMMIRRYCTNEFKVYPIRRLLRSEFKATYKRPVNTWLGYTIDEFTRMKDSKPKYEIRRYPLIEHRIYREQCIEYLNKHGWSEVERSACVCCPYRQDKEYDILTEQEKRALEELEEALNTTGYKMSEKSEPVEVRFHPTLIPIKERPYEKDNGQLELFEQMCDGASCFT